jgi:hypothetical protein
MQRKPLPLNTDQVTTVFRAVEKKLRAFPELKTVVKTWNTWTGEVGGRDGDVLEPATQHLPHLRMSLIPLPSHRITEGSDDSPVLIKIEAFVNGTNYDDIINLWGAVRRAVFSGDGTLQAIGQANNVTGVSLGVPGIGHETLEDGLILGAVGTLRISLWTDTAL